MLCGEIYLNARQIYVDLLRIELGIRLQDEQIHVYDGGEIIEHMTRIGIDRTDPYLYQLLDESCRNGIQRTRKGICIQLDDKSNLVSSVDFMIDTMKDIVSRALDYAEEINVCKILGYDK
jgi:hypothetical protein